MNRLGYMFIFMAIFSIFYQVGSMSQVDPDAARAFMEEFEELVDGIDAIGIFIHNTTLALPMVIPGFGIAWGMFASWSTGYAFASIATVTPQLADVPALSILYLSPFGLMELVAYSIATSRSYLLISTIVRKKSLMPSLRPTFIEIGVIVGLLLAGGFLEYYMLTLVQQGDLSLFRV